MAMNCKAISGDCILAIKSLTGDGKIVEQPEKIDKTKSKARQLRILYAVLCLGIVLLAVGLIIFLKL